MTFEEIIDEVMTDSFDAARYNARVKRWINDGASRIVRRVDSLQTEEQASLSVTAGVDYVAAPANLIRVQAVTRADRVPVSEITGRQLRELSASAGMPAVFALRKVSGSVRLMLWPTPSASTTFTLDYIAGEDELVDDSDEPQRIPAAYHDLLVSFAKSRAFRNEDDFEMARLWMEDFESDLRRMVSDLANPSRVRRHRTPSAFVEAAGPEFVRPS